MNLFNHNVFLIGFMGCGKSTIAKKLHHQFGLEVVEMDQVIADQVGMSIPEIFSSRGESYFRDCETSLLKDLAKKTGLIVSCGGGAALRPENAALMKNQGTVIYLTAAPETILERVSHSEDRPLLKNRKGLQEITDLLSSRQEAYENAADFTIPTDHRDTADIVSDIIQTLQGV